MTKRPTRRWMRRRRRWWWRCRRRWTRRRWGMIELVGVMMMTNEQLVKVNFAFIFLYLDF